MGQTAQKMGEEQQKAVAESEAKLKSAQAKAKAADAKSKDASAAAGKANAALISEKNRAQVAAANAAAEAKAGKKKADAAKAEADLLAKHLADVQEKAKKEEDAINRKIDDLNQHASAAQKIATEEARQASNAAAEATSEAEAAEKAAKEAKEKEKAAADAEKAANELAAAKEKASDEAQADAAAKSKIAGAAVAALNKEKAVALREKDVAAANAKQEEGVVDQMEVKAKTIKSEADQEIKKANEKKDAANAMLASIKKAKCSAHPGCKGLAGYCCPTIDYSHMHMGGTSSKLDGPVLGCCGSSEEAMEAVEVEPAEIEAAGEPQSAGLFAPVFAAFVAGSAVTAAVFKLTSSKEKNDAVYQHMGA